MAPGVVLVIEHGLETVETSEALTRLGTSVWESDAKDASEPENEAE